MSHFMISSIRIDRRTDGRSVVKYDRRIDKQNVLFQFINVTYKNVVKFAPTKV